MLNLIGTICRGTKLMTKIIKLNYQYKSIKAQKKPPIHSNILRANESDFVWVGGFVCWWFTFWFWYHHVSGTCNGETSSIIIIIINKYDEYICKCSAVHRDNHKPISVWKSFLIMWWFDISCGHRCLIPYCQLKVVKG